MLLPCARYRVKASNDRYAALRGDLEFQDQVLGQPMRFRTTWGLFSPRHIDDGTHLLLDHLVIAPDEQALDLGCGYGPLGLAIARAAPQGHCLLVDKDFVALEYARKNATLNGIGNIEVVMSNGFDQVTASPLTLVVSNLPAKSSNEQYQLFFYDAWRHLQPGGRVMIVSISGIREFVARQLREVFGNYDKVKQGKTYTVACSVKA